jgi:hypothetical protein
MRLLWSFTNSLDLEGLCLQLMEWPGALGVMGTPHARKHLKQLQLHSCELHDGEKGLAAALSLLPELEHLTFDGLVTTRGNRHIRFDSRALQGLQHLTSLVVQGCLQGPGKDSLGLTTALQPLQALTRLVELHLQDKGYAYSFPASVLSGAQLLTSLVLGGSLDFAPGAIAGKTQLQHLELDKITATGYSCEQGTAELLSHLQHMLQLTHLTLQRPRTQNLPTAAAFSALTASSKLQHLDISGRTLPKDVWAHMFPVGRQLPELRSLNISGVHKPSGEQHASPEGSILVSCCPGLQSLDMCHLKYSTELLAPLPEMTELRHCYCPVHTPEDVIVMGWRL